MFEKSLQDLIKGIRNTKRDRGTYISKQLASIRKELQSNDPYIKFVAVQKITYLHMLGMDVSFACFHIVEVMSAPKFGYRKAGMLAANQIFTQETDVILLCTNLLKKELHSAEALDCANALNCLGNIATKELARDLMDDVVSLLTHSRATIRKRAILTLYKLYVRYPHGLPATFERLRQRLDDTDMSVVSCTVNVICELSRKNPRNFLTLAPQLFALMTNSSNNWMLIKIVKLMSSLVTEEPRLARKILEPLATLVQTTHAKSLLYECIHAITISLVYAMKHEGSHMKLIPDVVALCASRLREFVMDSDQNLKCLGLVGLVNLMESHPNTVAENKEMIMQCLIDDDTTIRLRALELLCGLVTKRNLVGIVEKFLSLVHDATGAYREQLIDKIVFICSRDKYAYLSNFEWYVAVLTELAQINGSPRGDIVAAQLFDVTLRVPSIRSVAVQSMVELLNDSQFASGPQKHTDDTKHFVQVAASWIVGEYASTLNNQEVLESTLKGILLGPHVEEQHPSVQSSYIHNAAKIIAVCSMGSRSFFADNLDLLLERLKPLSLSEHIDVQERALILSQLLKSLNAKAEDLGPEHDTGSVLHRVFAVELRPVNPEAQNQVPVPEGLDLDMPIRLEVRRPLAARSSNSTPSFEGCAVGSLRVSFVAKTRVPQTTISSYNASSSDDEPDVTGRLLSSGKKSHKASKKHKHHKHEKARTPFYLDSSPGASEDTEEPEEVLSSRVESNTRRTNTSGSRVARVSDLYNDMAQVEIRTDDAMPVGAVRREKKVASNDQDDITLSNISFDLTAASSTTDTNNMPPSLEKPKSKKAHKEKKSKEKKKHQDQKKEKTEKKEKKHKKKSSEPAVSFI